MPRKAEPPNIYVIFWTLRNASQDWLRQNPDDPNAPSVRDAIKVANKIIRSTETLKQLAAAYKIGEKGGQTDAA